jgi:hypothetical protein
MRIADLSQKPHLAEPKPVRADAAVAAATAGFVAVVGAARKVVGRDSDEEILRRMRARPNLLSQGPPAQRPSGVAERLGGSAPTRP